MTRTGSRAALAFTALLFSWTAVGTAQAKDCDVKPFAAYSYAVQRGWEFFCIHGSLQPVPPSEMRCVAKTPPIVPPLHDVQAQFFEKSGASRGGGALNNGWKVKQFTATPQHERDGSGPGSGHAAVWFRVYLKSPNTTYNVRLKTLTLTKSGGSCSDWKQAFD